MAIVQLDGRAITDWRSFHQACRTAFGFPDFYGCNMDAWIDCLSALRDDDGMSAFALTADEMLQIEVLHSDTLRKKAPAILDALRDGTALVNQRCAETAEKPVLELMLR
jgi:hypothetical protein